MAGLVKHLKYQSPMVQEFSQNPLPDLYYFDKKREESKKREARSEKKGHGLNRMPRESTAAHSPRCSLLASLEQSMTAHVY
jgi:hypothetical protein